MIEGGIKVDHVGTLSVRYGFAVFRRGVAVPAAIGHFVHVDVDAETRRPKSPDKLRAVVKNLTMRVIGFGNHPAQQTLSSVG